MEGLFDGLVATFTFTIALSFIPASIITFSVKERENHVKHMHLVSGVSLLSYWISNFFMDFIKSLIPAIIGIIMM